MRLLSIIVAITAVTASAPAPAAAQSAAVDAARQSGAVGERYDGYIGLVLPASPGLRSQVAAINIRRRSLYNNLAAGKGVSPQEVGIAAGCQMLARVQAGQVYMLADRQWRRRVAGQPPSVPDYCR